MQAWCPWCSTAACSSWLLLWLSSSLSTTTFMLALRQRDRLSFSIIFHPHILGQGEESALHPGKFIIIIHTLCVLYDKVQWSSTFHIWTAKTWSVVKACGKPSHFDLNSDSHKGNFSHKVWLLQVGPVLSMVFATRLLPVLNKQHWKSAQLARPGSSLL